MEASAGWDEGCNILHKDYFMKLDSMMVLQEHLEVQGETSSRPRRAAKTTQPTKSSEAAPKATVPKTAPPKATQPLAKVSASLYFHANLYWSFNSKPFSPAI
jgi:hypothetical protein